MGKREYTLSEISEQVARLSAEAADSATAVRDQVRRIDAAIEAAFKTYNPGRVEGPRLWEDQVGPRIGLLTVRRMNERTGIAIEEEGPEPNPESPTATWEWTPQFKGWLADASLDTIVDALDHLPEMMARLRDSMQEQIERNRKATERAAAFADALGPLAKQGATAKKQPTSK